MKNLTIKDIFALRRAGKIEEAYDAILPMYKVHHGKYTSIAMFWCAVDKMNLLLTRVEGVDEASMAALHEAEGIMQSLKRLLEQLYDEGGTCKQTVKNMQAALEATRLKAMISNE